MKQISLPLWDKLVPDQGPFLVWHSCRMIAKLYTSPFSVPLDGGFAMRSNSGALQRYPAEENETYWE